MIRRWVSAVALSVVAISAVGAVKASAQTRFAAPGGTGPAPCLRSDPCSLYIAASYEAPEAERIRQGDEVVVLPGEYFGARGDLGPHEVVQIPSKADVHGEAGAPDPVIVSEAPGWVLTDAGIESTASDLEIVAPNSFAPLLVSQSIAQRMIVKTNAEFGIACELGFRAVLRDSVCISSGKKGAGAGERVGTNPFPMHTRTLRNVTAIGTGSESRGILFDISGAEISVSVKSSIARGTAADIEAIGEEGGPTITVEASDYATANAVVKEDGTASVTAPGTNGNITAAPLLAEATFHELPGSPTIDQGAVDSFTGSTDIDGDTRVIGAGIDMGADEMTLPTTTTLTCPPTSMVFGEEVSCAAVVEARNWGPPTGTVELSAAGGVELGECDLVTSGANQARCEVQAPLLALGPGLQLSAMYRGDGTRARSQGFATVSVDPAKTSVGISCAAAVALVDERTDCTASVADLGKSLAPPTGEVHFYSNGPGLFTGLPRCVLLQASRTSASCEVAYTPTGVGTGSHELSAIYPGDVGHEGATGRLGLSVMAGGRPARPPNTFLKARPPRRTSRRIAVFGFASSQPDTRFQCRLDSEQYHRCQSPTRLRVGRGGHIFSVRAIGAGGVDPTPATFRWVAVATSSAPRTAPA